MTLHVHETGTGHTPTLVLLHAGGVDGTTWQPQIEYFQHFHCLVPDLPGHGQSNDRPWVSFGDTAHRIANIIRSRANGGRAHVVGLSLGALVTLQLLQHAPELVDHVIASGFNVLPLPRTGLLKLVGRITAPLTKTELYIRASARSLNVPAHAYEQFRASVRRLDSASLTRVAHEALDVRLPPNLAHVSSPTLAVAGQRESIWARRSLLALSTAMPHAQTRIVPNVHHGWSIEAPDLFNRMVEAWISDQPLPAELLPVPHDL